MELLYAELSVPGRAREGNEDCVGFWRAAGQHTEGQCHGAVAVLADGVGSLGRAAEASRLAVEMSLRAFREAKCGGNARQVVREICRAANWAVYAASLAEADRQRMAATLALAAFCHDEVIAANVGDSRIYHVRDSQARQLSVDHSYVGVQRQFGLITEEEARNSHDRHMLTRSVGQGPEVEVDIASAPVAPGDRVVLCSDGLHNAINDRELGEIVSHAPPLEACRRLVALAQHRDAHDDISVQIIQIAALENNSPAAPAAAGNGRPITANMQPGQTLDNRFMLADVIARGGMATIYKAVNLEDDATVAIKIPLPRHEEGLRHEAEVLRQLTHGYILRFIAASNAPGHAYLVTEFVSGYSLAHLLRNICPLPESEARKIAGRLCEALDHLHARGFVHRDLKPHNVMLCPDDTLRVMDFGLATPVETRASFFRRFTQQTAGTPDYMAPEQVQNKAWDARTDLYSLGAMLYEMLTGTVPFAGDNAKAVMQARLHDDPRPPRQRNPNLSAGMEAIILRALARNPADRYQSAAALKADLDALRR